MTLFFDKYQGAGNDFIISISNAEESLLSSSQIEWLCNRRLGVGADGYIEIIEGKKADFEMRYYNADGNLGSMCGNGARCAMALAYRKRLIKEKATFLAYDGIHTGEIINENQVKISICDVSSIETIGNDYFLNTGSPHYVKFVSNLNNFLVNEEGKKIRHDKKFQPGGTNVNFVEKIGDKIYLRTFERGVENETLACGTGITAVGLVEMYRNSHLGKFQTVGLNAKGGDLVVSAIQNEPGNFTEILLEGPVRFVFSGQINL